jgi:hypothetical protein
VLIGLKVNMVVVHIPIFAISSYKAAGVVVDSPGSFGLVKEVDGKLSRAKSA